MSLMAGIFSRDPAGRVSESARAALRRLISRREGNVRAYEDARACLLKVDVGAYGEEAFVEDGEGVSMLAGEPLLDVGGGDSSHGRARDLELLHVEWKRGGRSLLSKASGAFCAVHYDRRSGSLGLFADKLCVRPLYFWADERHAVFATALRVFEGLDLVPKRLDLRAVTEQVALGAPLSDRTPYVGVLLLKAAEAVDVSADEIRRGRYWRWDTIPAADAPEPELLRASYGLFTRAVARRLRGNRTTAAFLSGGLDSRCVVAALVEQGARVHTFNFALPATQDQVFGAEFARLAGTAHEEVPLIVGTPDWSQMMADTWRASRERKGANPEHPELVWSGDGGSVGLGHVHMTPSIVAKMRGGERGAAADEFLAREMTDLPRRIMRGEVFDSLSESLRAAVVEELEEIHCDDPGRSFYVFLMLNDQRRHLARHYENVDLHRMEFHLPFMDGDLLAHTHSLPVDLCLRHGFYTKWLRLFPPYVTEAPWQTYPEHEPCPVPAPEGLVYQWEGAHPNARRAEKRRELQRVASEMLKSKEFPSPIFNRRNFMLAALVYRAGLRDFGYLFDAARVYGRYWEACGGACEMPKA
jgi:asparagine synthase (glutamine-hydrolysing)